MAQTEIQFLESLLKRKRSTKPIPLETIEQILAERPYVCELCGNKLTMEGRNNPKQRQLHHIIARRNGGSNKKENLSLICKDCHDRIESIIYQGENIWRRKIQARIKELKDETPYDSRELKKALRKLRSLI